MHPRRHIPTLIALVANAFLGMLLLEINHHLSAISVQVLIPASFVLFAGLSLTYPSGLLVCIVAGIMQDAALPTPPGYFTLALPILHFVLYRLSPKLHKEGGLDSLLITQALNLLVLLHLSFHFSQQYHTPLLPIILQILASQLLLLITAPTLLALQIALSTYLGVEVTDEETRNT